MSRRHLPRHLPGAFAVIALLAAPLAFTQSTPPLTPVLDQDCVVNVLNRTVQVSPEGGWSMPNVPSNMGRVRARATCSKNGQTFSGQTDYFTVIRDGVVTTGDIKFADQEQVPVSMVFTVPGATTLTSIGATVQLALRATYPDGSTRDVAGASDGANYSSTNSAIASVDAEGVVTAHSSGSVLITGRKDEVAAFKQIIVNAAGDADGDGIPDDFETANGLDPNDPIDAEEDQDGDGLTARREFQLGTHLRNPDSDADGLSDGEEVEAGADGFVTNPLNPDTDGDGLRDAIEILAGSSPTDPNDRSLEGALDRITVSPPSVVLTFNTINSEASAQLAVTGILIDGSTIDLTSKSIGTTYTSSNLNIVSFGLTDGEIFAGASGDATVTVRNAGKEFVVAVRVETFQPVALSSLTIPGYANNVDVSGDYAFIAAGDAGLQVVDVSNRAAPAVVAGLDTNGTAIDIRVLGNYAYIADGFAGVKIIDVSNPLLPALVGSVDTGGVAQDLKVDGELAYVADGNGGVLVLDVSDPTRPIIRGQVTGIGEVKGVDAEGATAVAVAGTSLYVIDVSTPAAPAAVGTVNIGLVKDVVVKGDYAYVAAYSSGYRVVNISDPTAPVVTGGGAEIVPRDVELSDGFAFFAEQLFPNVIGFVNVQDPEEPVFQGVINLLPFGDYAGTGIALDGGYAYVTEETFVVTQDFGTTGTTRLFIAQYRMVSDNGGVAPTITITRPSAAQPGVEGSTLIVEVDAQDDVGVRGVAISVDGVTFPMDTTQPYQVPVAIPFGKTSVTVSATAIDFGNNTRTVQVTVPVEKDTDHDGLGDQAETNIHHTDPNDADSDNDSLEDGEEVSLGTNPLAADTDGDGRSDSQEVAAGTDPRNPDITPPTVTAVDPVDGATGIPENRPVTVSFDERLQVQSIGEDTIQVRRIGDSTNVNGTVRLMPNGTDVVFVPAGLLADFTQYTVTASGARDLAGNLLAEPFTSSYTTGNLVDTTGPQIAVSNPVAAATGVPTNAIVRVQMNEPIDPLTVTAASFRVTDTVGPIAGTGTLSEDGRTLTFVPNAALAVRRQHTVFLTSIRDLFGNPTSQQFAFTTAFLADSTSPQIVATNMFDGQTGLPRNVKISVRFNEPINRLTLQGVRLLQGANELTVTRNVTVDAGGSVVELVPTQPLTSNTTYRLSIEAVEDLSGNVLAIPRVVTFTTGAIQQDTTPPQSIGRAPSSGAKNVPLNTIVEAFFSERMSPVSLSPDSIRLVDSATGGSVAGTITLSADGLTVRFVPAAPLKPQRVYQFLIAGLVSPEDQAGNRITASSDFTTGGASDLTPPQVLLQSIADGATGIAVNGRIVLDFDAPVSERCVNAQTVQLTQGGTPIVATLTLNPTRTQLIVASQQPLAANTAYTLRVLGVCDVANNVLANYSTTFTTGASAVADTIRPTITAFAPSQTEAIPVTSVFTLTFSEPIDVTTLAGGFQAVVAGQSGELPGTLTVNGTVVTFTPTDPLPGDKSITITVAGVADLSGNIVISRVFAVFTGSASDVTAPQVLSITPNDGLVDVLPNSTIVLTFSEALSSPTVNSDNFLLFVNGEIVRPLVSRSDDNRTITLFTSSVLPAASIVSVIVTGNVTDLSGNRLADFVSAFTTSAAIDAGRPSVVTQFPGTGSTSVLPDATVVLYTNDRLNTATVPQALHVSQNGRLVNGTITYTGNDQVITFRPNQPWSAGAFVEVFLDNNARDLEGNALNNFQSSFRTLADPTTVRPAVVGISTAGLNGLPRNPIIDILFSEPVDPASVTAANISLRDVSAAQNVPTTLSVIKGGLVVRMQPTVLLGASRNFNVNVQSAVRDLQGQTLQFSTSPSFTTSAATAGDTVGPSVVRLSPPSGSTNVGINALTHAIFDEPINFFSLSQPDSTQTRYGSILISSTGREVQYVRHTPLAPSSAITESVAEAEDLAGNLAQGITSTTFTTGTGPDVIPPVVLASTPIPSQVAPVSTIVRFRFNEPIDPASITDQTVRVTDTFITANVPGSATLEPDQRTLTFVPSQALPVGRPHNAQALVRDLAGNTVSAFLQFTTTFAPDTTAPQILSTSVSSGQTGVPTNAVIAVRFTEPVDTLTLEDIKLLLAGQPVATTFAFTGDRMTVRLRLVEPLEANASYVFSVSGAKDTSGNALLAPVSITFSTGAGPDAVAPTLVMRRPQQGDGSVPLNAMLEAQLSERLNPASVTTDSVRLLDINSSQLIAGTVSVTSDGRTIRFVPSANLNRRSSFVLTISANTFVEDLAGNRFSGSWSFSTGDAADTVAPQLALQSIADGATGIVVNGKAVFSFDAQLSDGCVNSQTVQLSTGGVPVAAIATLDADRKQITVEGQGALATSTTYTVRLQGLCDISGNVVGPITSSFTTSASAVPDEVMPFVTAFSPADGAVNVPVTSPIVVTFSEPIDVTKLDRGEILVQRGGAIISGSITVVGNVVTFTPQDPLPGDTDIFVAVTSVQDLAGNGIGGEQWSFHTATAAADVTAPHIISITPADGAVDVPTSTPMVLTFSEPLDPSTIVRSSFAVFVNGEARNEDGAFGVQHSSDNRTVILSSIPFPSSVVSIIATSDLKDVSGNRMTDFVSAYATSASRDTQRPNIITQYPANGASNVLPDAKVILFANDSIAPGTLQQGLHVTQNGVLVNGTVTLSASNQAVMFQPSQPWEFGSLIEVFVDSNTTDDAGNPFNNHHTSFRVGTNSAANPPAITGAGVTSGLPLNAVIDALASEPLDPASVSTATVSLRDNTTQQTVPISVSLVKNGHIVRILPQVPLVASRSYLAIYGVGIRDLQGQSPVSNLGITVFVAAGAVSDTQAPTIVSLSPPNGSSGVGVNGHVHARFDESVNPLSFIVDPLRTRGTILWSNSNREVRFLPHEPYAAGAQITESFESVEDLGGNSVLAPFSTTFTTRNGADVADPAIADSTPRFGAGNVPVNAVVKLRFNEQMDPVSVSSSTIGVITSQGVVAGSAALDPDGRTATFVPNAAWQPGIQHTINVVNGVRDLAGNLVFPQTLTFVTTAGTDTLAPLLLQTSMIDGLTNVPINARLMALFDEPLNALAVEGFTLRQGGQLVPGTVTASTDRRLLTLKTQQPLLPNTTYVLGVSGVTDLSGNVLAVPRNVTFTTGAGADLVIPQVTQRLPTAGATGVVRNVQPEVVFSERMNPATTASGSVRLIIHNTGQVVPTTFSLSADGRTVRLVPSTILTASTVYRVEIQFNDLIPQDLAGNRANGSWTFTTGAL